MPLIDQTDALILKLLQSKGNVKRVEIAKETQLSVPTVSARIRKMEKLGLIEGYTLCWTARSSASMSLPSSASL